MADEKPPPKVFISYSWTSPAHQERVREWAERLLADGVDVLLDVFDLKEGDDKYAFMERLVTDPEVSHVIVVCDKRYAEKADQRSAGVGTESQIISKKVYDQVQESKFVPLVCEFDETGEPILPAMFKARVWIDFSSPGMVNENWEKLIRFLFGKPLHKKPKVGAAPLYIRSEVAIPTSPLIAKLASLKHVYVNGLPGLAMHRGDFFDACFELVNELQPPAGGADVGTYAEQLVELCTKLQVVRDRLVDWLLIEGTSTSEQDFAQTVVALLERVRGKKQEAEMADGASTLWREGISLFAFETFLYAVAGLLARNRFETLHEVFATHYYLPERMDGEQFDSFASFYAYTDSLGAVLPDAGRRSNTGALLKKQANRTDLSFRSIVEADLLAMVMSLIGDAGKWYPQALLYSEHWTNFPFFVKATRHKGFQDFATVTGVGSVPELRKLLQEGVEKHNVANWSVFQHYASLPGVINLDKLDTIR